MVSEEAGYHKPDPRLFREALKRTGVDHPERVIFVGDTLSADIEGALRAGFQPVFINPEDNQTPPDGVLKIRALSELLSFLPLS